MGKAIPRSVANPLGAGGLSDDLDDFSVHPVGQLELEPVGWREQVVPLLVQLERGGAEERPSQQSLSEEEVVDRGQGHRPRSPGVGGSGDKAWPICGPGAEARRIGPVSVPDQ